MIKILILGMGISLYAETMRYGYSAIPPVHSNSSYRVCELGQYESIKVIKSKKRVEGYILVKSLEQKCIGYIPKAWILKNGK